MYSKGLLGIEISEHLIRYVHVVPKSGSYCVTAAGKSAYIDDMLAPGVLSTLIHEIVRQEQLAPERIFIALSRKDTIVHQFVMPRTSQKELANIVFGEIEKIPAFGDQDFDFTLQAYPYLKSNVKVVFAALLDSFIKRLFEEISSTGLVMRDIDIVPLTLKELFSLKLDKERQVVLSLYDQMSYLFIVTKGEYALIYKSSVGSQVLLDAKSSAINERILSNWLAEFKRALKAYASEQPAEQPVNKIVLVWDRESMPDLDRRVAQILGLDVDIISGNILPGIEWKGAEGGNNPAFLSALASVICRAKKMKTVFSSEYFLRNFYSKKYLVKLMLIFTVFAAALGIVSLALTAGLSQKKQALIQEQENLAQDIRDSELKTKELFAKKAEYESNRQRLLSQATYVNYLNRVSWSQVFAMIAKEMPEDLALKSFRFSETGNAEIKGEAFDMDSIAGVMRRIEESAILEKGKFDFLTEKKLKDDYKIYNFGILATLKETESKPGVQEKVETKDEK